MKELYRRFFDQMKVALAQHPLLCSYPWEHGPIGRLEADLRGIHLNFTIAATKGGGNVQLYLDGKRCRHNQSIFKELEEHREAIDAANDLELKWKRGFCPTITSERIPGQLRDASKWELLQQKMMDAMVQLDAALAPHLDDHRAS